MQTIATFSSTAVATNTLLQRVSLNGEATSEAVANHTEIVSFRRRGYQGSLSEAVSKELTSGEFQVTFQLQFPTLPTLAYTVRKNIVLKLREVIKQRVSIHRGESIDINQIEGAADFRSIVTDDMVSSTPAVFVVPRKSDAGDNTKLGPGIQQRVTDRYGVLIAVDNLTDEFGVNAFDLIRALHNQILLALLNWRVPETRYDTSVPGSQLLYEGGAILGMTNDTIYWQDNFYCYSFYRAEVNL